MSNTELAPAFFLAVIVILLACRALARLLRGAHQPPVVGEMIAGVVLGPSVLGLVSPWAESHLFPQQLRPVLYVVGQVGLVVFMFQTGYELRVAQLRKLAGSSGLISAVGIVLPGALGIGLTYVASGRVDVFVTGVPLLVTALFIGVALAITAFPMMARIIVERGLAGSRFGSVALTCGAIDDAVAWVLLAGVLSLAAATAGPVALAVGGTVGFVGLLLAAHRGLRRVLTSNVSPESLVLLSVVALLLAAWYTDKIGLYAVFGAFALGVAFPRSKQGDAVIATVAPVSRLVFLPLFFVSSGLNTNFGLLSDSGVLVFAMACVILAVVGKFGGCTIAARLVGEPMPIAIRIGALMNARGLMQLIALNVGLSAGIVSPSLFTVLVLVALVTTMMAAPLLSWFDHRDRRRGLDPTAFLFDVEAKPEVKTPSDSPAPGEEREWSQGERPGHHRDERVTATGEQLPREQAREG